MLIVDFNVENICIGQTDRQTDRTSFIRVLVLFDLYVSVDGHLAQQFLPIVLL